MGLTRKDAKELLIKTLDIRGCCTDRELSALPEFHILPVNTPANLELILDELVNYGEIIAVEFHSDDKPDDMRVVYFPLGTCVYEPGIRIKSRVLPGFVAKGLKALKEKGIVNDDMLEGVSRQKLVDFYEAVHKHVVENKHLNAEQALNILNKVPDRIHLQ